MRDFRFRKEDLSLLMEQLRTPLAKYLEFTGQTDYVKCRHRYKVPYETGVLMILYRLAHPHRVRSDIERMFHCRHSHVSAICNTFIDAFYEVALKYLSDPVLLFPRFPKYSKAIKKKTRCTGLLLWGFIDGTLKGICCPSKHQKVAYSGHKRIHGINFQNVMTPDGYIAHLFRPIAGSRHDSYMFGVSEIRAKLEIAMPGTDGAPVYAMYGDPAYPLSQYLLGGVNRAAAGSAEVAWNKTMSRARICVEWTFGEVGKVFRSMSLKQGMQLYRVPVAKYYFAAVFLLNCCNSLYGGQTADYFDCLPLLLEEYIDLVDWN
jgi:hypothetical protein